MQQRAVQDREGPDALARTLLPVGGIEKSRTRQIAEEAGLPVFGKPDSQEICFVPTGDYRDMLRGTGGLGREGAIRDLSGRELARHDGYMGFTRGQRRGLGIAHTEPLYVIDVHPESGDVFVGPRPATVIRSATVDAFATFGCKLAPGETWTDLEVQFRSSPGGVPGSLHCTAPGEVRIDFTTPAESVTPGQGLAVYRDDRLLGGGWIRTAEIPEDARVCV